MFWFKKCLIQYSDFSTRARRREYWWFLTILTIIMSLVSWIFGVKIQPGDLMHINRDLILSAGMVPALICCAFICPYFAVTVRRLHDINKSAWWLLVLIIPLIGNIWMFFLMITPGVYYDNQWGRNPKLVILN